jgi:hypothetical protein
MDLIIQFVGSFVLFLNKVLLWKKNNFGWILGIVGITTLCWPAYQKHLWIMIVYSIGLAVVMAYGYILSQGLKEKISKSLELFIKFLILFLTFSLCVYLYIETYSSKNFNETQLFQATTGLAAALLLALNTRKTIIAGWVFNIASHFFATHLMISTNLPIIAFFQILSVFIAILAIRKEIRTRPSP